jgi:hypothetical protein
MPAMIQERSFSIMLGQWLLVLLVWIVLATAAIVFVAAVLVDANFPRRRKQPIKPMEVRKTFARQNTA